MEADMVTSEHNDERFVNKFITSKSPINLSQTYRGLLLSHPVQYLKSLNDQVLFHANQHVICLSNKSNVYLHGEDFTNAIAAKIDAFDLFTGELTVRDFHELRNIWAERKHIRVMPFEPLMVNLITKTKNYRGNFSNISLEGAAILLHRQETENLILHTGENVILQFSIPNSRKLSLQGKVVNLNVLENHLLRIGLTTQSTANERKILQNYIQMNYELTMKKINESCSQILAPPQTKDLFF
jgi:hypothetical protein